MSAPAPDAVKANGLSTVVNTIAAPEEAFQTIRVAPTWGWALVLAAVLMLIGSFLQGPASRHAATVSMQQNINTSSIFANMKPEQKTQAIANAGKPSPWGYFFAIVVLFVAVFFNAFIMLIGNAVGHGQADFKRLWAGSMNIAVPTLGLSGIVWGLILTIRGADSFNSQADLLRALPGLGMLAGNAGVVTAAFLSAITIFSLWGLYLNATMLRVTAKTNAAVAYIFAAIVLLLGATLAAALTSIAHGFGLA